MTPESSTTPSESVPIALTACSSSSKSIHNTAPAVNTHPTQSRSKSTTFQPIIHPSIFISHSEPMSVKQALEDTNWLAAMQKEYDALMQQNTWNLVSLPSNRGVVGYKWVFRVKENTNGSINKYKACLVAKGFHQVHGFNFHETFSPVVKPIIIRIILTCLLWMETVSAQY